MKKWGILFLGLVLGITLSAQAETDMSALFSSNNQNIIYSNTPKEYTGSPLVFIEGISDKPQPKGWRDEMKIKLFGSMELPKQEIQKPLPPLEQKNIQQGIKIHSLFRGEKTVAFVPHTSDWNFIIQVLNDEELVIQEDIQLIKTKETPPLVRDWHKQDMTLLDIQINGRPVSRQLKEEQDILKLELPNLETGVHKIHLSYLIKKSGMFSKRDASIKFSMTNTGWPLTADSLTGVILFPKEIKESQMTFLFGKNKQKIPQAFEVIKDKSGALFFRSTHLIPAQAPIQMELNLKFDSFIKKSIFDKLSTSTSFLIFIITLCVMLGYLVLNVIEIKITPIETTKSKTIPTSKWKAFWARTQEMWIGLLLLLGGSLITLKLMQTSLTSFEIQLLFLIPILFVLLVDYLLLYPRQEKIRKIKEIK